MNEVTAESGTHDRSGPYNVSTSVSLRQNQPPLQERSRILRLKRSARGAVRMGLIVALNVFGVFAFAGALFASLDLWLIGAGVALIIGGISWVLDTIWLYLRPGISRFFRVDRKLEGQL